MRYLCNVCDLEQCDGKLLVTLLHVLLASTAAALLQDLSQLLPLLPLRLHTRTEELLIWTTPKGRVSTVRGITAFLLLYAPPLGGIQPCLRARVHEILGQCT